VICTGGCRYS